MNSSAKGVAISCIGNLRNELLVGESGPDLLVGDWGSGPNYNANPAAATTGGDDTLLGGAGQDQAYGGGGNDVLRGGGDGDWLEGQEGMDELVGGGGIDFLVLDVDPSYSALGGESFDGHGDGTPEDNATDVLLINGTTGDDVIRIGGTADGRLSVSYNGATIEADWTDATGPLVEQIRVAGLTGNDDIRFDSSLDLSVLSARSRDFVTIIEGGPGNDTLVGSSARDRIDGGRGGDLIFGLAGDDRLWGDQGPGDGSIADHDVIHAGGGNDDVLGGQGTNALYAWSSDPSAEDPFGVFIDVDGVPELENTGLNRIIGGPNDDELYGGTGLDLLYGGEGNNTLYTRNGETFESLDGGVADDAWKDYARSTGQVWYVGGTNSDDRINLDFVTEPGILQGHHLMTRLTRNSNESGNAEDFFTFDAQVRLDFAATDGDGNLVWNPNDLFADGGSLQNDDPFARAEMLNQRFSDAVALSRLLPPEDDFRAIIIDALGGNDEIVVGPTVQKTVWIDAGDGDDKVLIASGRSILIDQTDDLAARNDSPESAFPLAGPPVITGTAISNPILNADATFFLIVDDLEDHVRIDVPSLMTNGLASGTVANGTLQDLIDDINLRIGQSEAAGQVIATLSGDSVSLSGTSVGPTSRLAISADAGDPAVTQLGLPANASATPSPTLATSTTFTGLTIDNPSDVDSYILEVASTGSARITIDSLNANDGMELMLFERDNPSQIIELIDGVGELTSGVAYVLQVRSNSIPTVYELTIDLFDGNRPVVVDHGAIVEFQRQDVIFGGNGNDILQGGPGEDFIFAGAGNDVLTGGSDRGASDLLFGQDGNDTLQTIPDGLPTLTGTGTTFLPTQSDRFDGGAGNDRVLFLGGNVDSEGRPVNDFVSVRFNRLLQRYELTALVWDVANQRYLRPKLLLFTRKRRASFRTITTSLRWA